MDRLYAYKRVAVWALPLLVMVVILSSCYTNKSIMLKTPDDYPFAVYNDSLNNKETYKIAVADFVNVIKFIYQQPQSICIRDMVIAPTSYEN